ncbi:hypothetical protein [Actinomycetospora flava]|uniref:Uncharacterized protein n=1 Tax=Actinomycetospora flava TaxID=3129232 RepID=A0ABU8M6D9_9PSEU
MSGESGDQDEHPLGLLVLVDVLWARWAPLTKEPAAAQSSLRHDGLLVSLLHGAGSLGDTYGDAALRHVPRVPEFERAWARAAPGERAQVDELLAYHPPEARWSTSQHLDRDRLDIISGLRAFGEARTRRAPISIDLLEAATNLYSHRVYLEGPQLLRLGAEPQRTIRPGLPTWAGLHACLDFRVRHQLGYFWLYATISLWSSRPQSRRHAPPSPAAVVPADGDIRQFRRLFQQWRDGFRETLYHHHLPLRPTVLQDADSTSFRRKYRAPRFWIVGCRAHAEASTPPQDCRRVQELCRAALDVPGPEASDVAVEVVESTRRVFMGDEMPLLVLRRLKRLPEGAAPAYVVAPWRAGDEALQEDVVQELIYEFSDVETTIAAHLFDRTTELDIDDGFAGIYEAVVYRASELWDQLALRLPLLRGRELDDLHQLIELVHLTLLQGLADLGYLKAKVSREAALLESANDDDIDRLTQSFVGSEMPELGRGLGESLRSGGYVRPIHRWARDVEVSATSALEHFTSLLDAISKAFDERRVRETDRIGSYGVVVALVLGFVGFAAETWGAVVDVPDVDAVPILSFIGLIAIATALGRWIWARWFRTLGSLTVSDYFRTAYPPVSDYLQLCRTERIARLDEVEMARQQDDLDDPETDDLASYTEYHRRWHEIDLRLARQYAGVVDRLQEIPSRSEREDGLGGVRAAVELWAVHALLLSERPRTFYDRPLPCLAMMYRFYPAHPEDAGLRGRAGPPLSVSDADLLLTLRMQCGAEVDDIPTVVAWGRKLRDRVEADGLGAAEMLKKIEASGLRSGMGSTEWRQTFATLEAAVGDRRDGGPRTAGQDRPRSAVAAGDVPAARNGSAPTVARRP